MMVESVERTNDKEEEIIYNLIHSNINDMIEIMNKKKKIKEKESFDNKKFLEFVRTLKKEKDVPVILRDALIKELTAQYVANLVEKEMSSCFDRFLKRV